METTNRPERDVQAVMYQGWRRISFLHWRIDPAVVQARLPDGLAADTFDGASFIGLTPFQLTGLRLAGLPPLPGVSSFPETNLRTYVRGPGGPGVWFFSLDAGSTLAVWGARLTYGLPYRRATMSVRGDGHRVEYASRRAAAAIDVTVDVREPLREPDDLARFLTERYRLYSRLHGRLVTAPVAHAPWLLRQAVVVRLRETVRRAEGVPEDASTPLAHYSDGVDVRVGAPRRV